MTPAIHSASGLTRLSAQSSSLSSSQLALLVDRRPDEGEDPDDKDEDTVADRDDFDKRYGVGRFRNMLFSEESFVFDEKRARRVDNLRGMLLDRELCLLVDELRTLRCCDDVRVARGADVTELERRRSATVSRSSSLLSSLLSSSLSAKELPLGDLP